MDFILLFVGPPLYRVKDVECVTLDWNSVDYYLHIKY
jgi:hypothetical protein